MNPSPVPLNRRNFLAQTTATLVALGVNARAAVKLPRLRVSASGHFLTTNNGRPFFWLGDTAWTLFEKLTLDEAALYFRDRARKRFTVGQAHLLNWKVETGNVEGELAFLRGDFDAPNEAYWRRVDKLIDLAAQHGLYLALLPVWARNYMEGKETPRPLLDAAQARRYDKFLGARYRDQTHLVWVLGGDVRPTQHPTYDSLARGLAEGAGNARSLPLMSYHPPGGTFRPPATSTGEFYHDKTWLDFNMIQSGHRLGNKNYERITEDYHRLPAKPTLDAEPCYEGHPIEHKFEKGVFTASEVRRRAYWSLLAGACGFTYGANGIWQMDKPGAILQATHHNRFWSEALDLEGAKQMQHVRALFESRPFIKPERVPDQSILVSSEGETDDRVQCARAADRSY